MLIAKKYDPVPLGKEKVRLILLAPVETWDECSHVVLTVDEYASLNKAKVCLDAIVEIEKRKSDTISMRDSSKKGSDEWTAYNKKLKSIMINRLRIIRRVMAVIDHSKKSGP